MESMFLWVVNSSSLELGGVLANMDSHSELGFPRSQLPKANISLDVSSSAYPKTKIARRTPPNTCRGLSGVGLRAPRAKSVEIGIYFQCVNLVVGHSRRR